MAGLGRKLAWFVAIWAMSVMAIGAVGFTIRMAIVP
jgi:Protein of unknown function (DUF2474)